MAESAVGSGGEIVAVDFFGDRDQARVVESYAIGRDLGLPLTAAGLARAAGRLGAAAVAYGANLENHPAVVKRLGTRCEVLGNGYRTLREARDWRLLREFCAEAGIAHPVTLFAGEEARAAAGGRWLRKRVRSGGGHGVRRWDGAPLDGAHLLQAEVQGRAASAAFVADGRAARLLGLTEQLLGDRRFGASRWAWCGNVLPLEAATRDGGRLAEEVAALAGRLTRRFGLRGVNGLDLVVRSAPDGTLVPYLIEINPRYTGSMELVEHAYGVNVFAAHREALAGRLPAAACGLRPPAGFIGKAVVYARRFVTAPDTDHWLDEGVRDVPRGGQPIDAGHPVCTVLALDPRGRDACLEDLHVKAARIEAELQPRRAAKGDAP
jgi:hypothetical protein